MTGLEENKIFYRAIIYNKSVDSLKLVVVTVF